VAERGELIRIAAAQTARAPLDIHVAINHSADLDLVEVAAAGERRDRQPVATVPGRSLAPADLPPVDLLVRTGGQQRLSGFLPMQTAYAELFFTDTLWPELTHADLEAAFRWFALQDRRYGE
jgi:undecaprenyl diphosphate synthase